MGRKGRDRKTPLLPQREPPLPEPDTDSSRQTCLGAVRVARTHPLTRTGGGPSAHSGPERARTPKKRGPGGAPQRLLPSTVPCGEARVVFGAAGCLRRKPDQDVPFRGHWVRKQASVDAFGPTPLPPAADLRPPALPRLVY
ncbi:hypothetical protein HPB47_026184 [Ixodes persulcatus]|uniref:Uncharacterized protein n=1 Tax=Ixodes persulcatus TaxID=34615 RepID=A0AC60PZE3_IXOPE|nr:hypothetical protein HPB47_026184 [Ixodes persulcatus]